MFKKVDMILCFGRNENRMSALSARLRANGYAAVACFEPEDAARTLSTFPISAVVGDELLLSPEGGVLRRRVFGLDRPVPLVYLPQSLQVCKEPECNDYETLLRLISGLLQ